MRAKEVITIAAIPFIGVAAIVGFLVYITTQYVFGAVKDIIRYYRCKCGI